MRNRRRRRISDSGTGASPIQLLGLSLFIMLLAFFIVLNSVSSFNEDKIKPVMNSIDQTFSTRMEDIAARRPSTRPDEETESRGEGRYPGLKQLENLFRSFIVGAEIQTDYDKGTMWVRMDYESLNKTILKAASPSGTPLPEEEGADDNFLATLVSLMETQAQSQVYRMDMLLNTEETPVELKLDRPAVFQRERDRIGKLSRMLEQAGVSPGQISIGLRSGEEDQVDLVFRASYPHDALQGMKEPPPDDNEDIPAGGVM
jgi:hypothetical protein